MKARILYTGLNCPKDSIDYQYIHRPTISIEATPINNEPMKNAFLTTLNITHVISTSKEALTLFQARALFFNRHDLLALPVFVVGKESYAHAIRLGLHPVEPPAEETQEGLFKSIVQNTCNESILFWGHSGLSRPYLKQQINQLYKMESFVLYKTQLEHIYCDLTDIDAVFFSSPSTVKGFLTSFDVLPRGKILIPQGRITQDYIEAVLKSTSYSLVTFNDRNCVIVG